MNSPRIISPDHQRAIELREQGRHEEALPFWSNCLSTRVDEHGLDDQTLSLAVATAQCMDLVGKPASALDLYEFFFNQVKDRVEKDFAVVNLMRYRAESLEKNNRRSQALAAWSGVMEAARNLDLAYLTERSWRQEFAKALMRARRYRSALQKWRRLIKFVESADAPDSASTIEFARSRIAICQMCICDFQSAVRTWRTVLERYDEAVPANNVQKLAIEKLAECLATLARHTEALPLWKKAVALRQAQFGENSPAALYCVRGLERSSKALCAPVA